MRNLKRALSLALASIMVLGLMVVGASAASFNDFTDKDEVTHKDAVAMITELGILAGLPDGSFGPTQNIDRASFARLVCVVLNGGQEPTLGNLTTSFTDTKGNWAEKYIAYCVEQGIIAGRGDGTFAPSANVTGSEAAKMLLVALGYNATYEGIGGATWQTTTDVRANQAGLYKDLETMNTSAPLTRDDACQMIYNALMATEVKYELVPSISADGQISMVAQRTNVTKISNDETVNVTLLMDKFNAVTETGYLSKVDYDKDSKEYTYTVSGAVNSTSTDLASGAAALTDLTTTGDFTSLMGQKVNVIYTVKNGKTDKVFGMYSDSKNVLVTTVGEITAPSTVTDKSFKVNGTKYNLDVAFNGTNAYTYTFNAEMSDSTTLNAITADKSSTVIFVSDDNNSSFNYAVVIPVAVGKVTYVGKDSITAKNATYKFEDDVIADGIAKDDYVKITAAANSFDGMNHIDAIEAVSGEVTGLRSNEVCVDGTWYKTSTLDSNSDELKLNETYDLFVVGSYAYYAKQVSESASLENLVYVSASEQAGSISSAKAEVYYADGTKKIVDVTKIDGEKIESGNDVTVGLYTFKEKDGSYELTTVDADNKLGYSDYDATAGKFTAKTDDATAKLGSYVIADDAVIFVNSDTDGVKVITGAALKDFNKDYGTSSVALTKTVSGLKTVMVAAITATGDIPGSTGETDNYGYITSKPYQVKVGDDTFYTYTIWTGDSSVDVYDEDSTLDVSKGQIISYTDLGNNHIEDTTKVGTPVAITGFDGTNLVMYTMTGAQVTDATKVNKDTVYLYINSEDATGIQNGEIGLAQQNADGSYVANALYVAGDNNNAALVVYDVNNKLKDGGDAGVTVKWNGTKITGTATGLTVDNMTVTAGKAVVGEKVAITVTLDTTDKVTLSGDVKLTVDGTGVESTEATVKAGSYDKDYKVVIQVPVTAATVENVQVTIADAD